MILFLINLVGAVALLLWAVGLIRRGVERAFMTQLRTGLRRTANRPATAVLGGGAAAILLQSSTAVAMLAAAFASAGTLGSVAGLALLLGADIGSAIVAQILLSPISALIPALLVVGVTLFFGGRVRAAKQTGRILIGLALVLVSLAMIRTAGAQMRDSPFIEIVMGYLANDPVGAFVMGAVIAWAMHSSVAAVLTFATFVAEGVMPTSAAAALVLGANLGGAAIPMVLTRSAAITARRIVIGNLLLRGGGATLALVALIYWITDLSWLGELPHRQIINLHLAFNIAMAALALPLIRPVLRLVAILVPELASGPGPSRLSALDASAQGDPGRALACAAREVLRMGESVQSMLTPALGLYQKWDPGTVSDIAACENDVDRMHFEIKLYIARLQKDGLDTDQARRAMDIVTTANNLEDAGDQVSTNLVDMAKRMQSEGLNFSESGWRDLADFHDRVLSNTQLALNVMMTGDADAARQLVEEKDRMRQAEQMLQIRHLERLRQNNPATIETSNLHQETIRALKQINTAYSLVAYPIAEEAGDLLSSRLTAPSMGGS